MTNTMTTETREQRRQQLEKTWAERQQREMERAEMMVGPVGTGRRA